MRLVLLGSILSLSLLLSACATPPRQESYAEISSSYIKGHLEMLASYAPWMTEAERRAHAQAQANEVVKSLRLQFETGVETQPVIIPIPEAPANTVTQTVKTTPAPTPPTPAPQKVVQVAAPKTQPAATPKPPVATATPPATQSKAASTPSVAGTYVLENGNYSINVEQEGKNLVVVEPNKRSLYKNQGDGSYEFYNANTGSTFSLRFLDEYTLKADRVPSVGTPSILKRKPAPAVARAATENKNHNTIAAHYSELARTDTLNTQAWTTCAAVAFKRSQSEDQDFARYADQAVRGLKLILVNNQNPCPDAIPDVYW